MTQTTERKTGSDLTGSDGATNRVLTLANTGLTNNDAFDVYLNGILLRLSTDYTVSHLSASSTVTFLGNVLNDSYIIVQYTDTSVSSTTNYCTASEVGTFLNVTFSGSTTPTTSAVEALIANNEDWIDENTNHAWRIKTISSETHHQSGVAYNATDGTEIFLHNRKIRTLDDAEGDSLLVWNGSTWEDYLTTRVEGRINDFWLDYDLGILFVKGFTFTSQRFFSVKISYRFGENAVKKDIKKACILLTAADIIENDDRSVLLPEGTSNMPLMEKARSWREQAEVILDHNREIKAVGM